ncbi:stalk domain-containing protein [Cohnella thailandensis]|uniref:Copper amine oxidase n=1 Tax=Cohnella thailandensis TaxID=557557 RepID=A0A841T0D3_9BACL|nr:stalk domain-containing protein [Cohnella thailandensis]MBB6635540.1 copper amine oxidase [Cohnella thailandensis]MBP1974920.1 hypothetical protein [Cohnella thailandensis]
MKKSIGYALLSSMLLGSLAPSAASGADAKTEPLISSYETEYGHSSLVKSDGTYWIWGMANLPSVPTQLQGLTDVTATFGDNFLKKTDGSLWYWSKATQSTGMNLYKIEGIQDPVDVPFVYGDNAIVIDAKGDVYKGSQSYPDYIPGPYTKLAGIDNVKEVSLYGDSLAQKTIFVFLKKDGTVWRTDATYSTFVQAQEIVGAERVQADGVYLKDGTIREWPSSYNVAGYDKVKGDWASTSSIPVKGLPERLIFAWRNGTSNVAIDEQRRLWFWGATITGWSDGTTMNSQPAPIRLTGVQDVKEAYVAGRSLFALTQSGKVYEASIELRDMPANAEFKLLASDVVNMKPASKHLLMQKTDGTLWGWGLNKYGSLGIGEDKEVEIRTPVQLQTPIEVVLNGESIALTNGVITRNGQAFVPLRSIFEKLGARISWEAESKIATLEREATGQTAAVAMKINLKDGTTTLNGETVKLQNDPFGASGTSYLPLRFISETLGAKVEWQQKAGKIVITMS